MPIFQVSVRRLKNSNGIRLEPVMSVRVVTQGLNNPVITNGEQPFIFM